MSVGQDFDPSLLEGKDRAELVAIATSLGQKPPARAKKETVIALIMELVGAPAGGDDGADGDDDHADAADASADAGSDDPAGEAEAGADAEGDASDEGQADGGDEAAGDEADGGDGAGDGSSDGGDQQDQGNQGGQQGGDDLEPGNRRRRRRGRDRDRRPEGDEQPVEPVEVEGLVDLREEGYGFLRLHGFLPSRDDAYISVKQTRQFGLRTGDVVKGKARPANRNEKNPALLQVERVNGHPSHQQPARRRFEELTPLYPDERLRLETDDVANTVGRAIDVAAPVGKGQRTLILTPPRSGRSEAVREIAKAVAQNQPDVEVIVLLVDERPEEAAALQRAVADVDVEVAASAFDRPADEHVSVAELAVERAKRLVESGADVVLVVDGITRLVRAYDQAGPASGRQVSGVVDTTSLFQAKRLFGAARKAEGGGSLTVLATVLVDTGARFDDVVHGEFGATPNSVVRLQPLGADGGGAPIVDVDGSSTEHEDVLLGADLAQVRADRERLRAEVAKG